MSSKKSEQHFYHKFNNFWETRKIERKSRIVLGVAWNIVLFFIVIGLFGFLFVGGVGAGYFASLVDDEEIRDYESMEKDIYNYAETSRMYFDDNVYLGEVQADLYRDAVSLNDISPHLVNAIIATEDEHFPEHDGVVPKALMRAMLQEVTNAPIQTGGSTLTQQLVKNQVLTNEVSFERKAKEILLALRIERFFEKEDILEAYLNIVPFGRNSSGKNIAGVQTASQGVFGINAKDLNLAQAAFLAGLPQSPSAYTPYASGGGLKEEAYMQAGLNRMQTVLNRMLEMEYITAEQYQIATNYDIVADFKTKRESTHEAYPILSWEIRLEAEKILYNIFAEEAGLTEAELKARPDLQEELTINAKRALERNGYDIHTTIDKDIYDAFQEVAENFTNWGPNTMTNMYGEQYVQGAAIMIENATGRIISFLPSREYSEQDQLNYTKQRRSNGSTMKPILVYGPALEEGILQPGTPIADIPLTLNDGTTINNIDFRHHGLLSTRVNLTRSYNTTAVRAYLDLIDINPVEKYLVPMGITTLEDDEYAHPSLALGGTSYGIPLEDTANAYATIANNGQFIDAYMVEKITTSDGEIIYEHKAEPVEVFSPQTSYLLLDMMRDVITQGTAGGLPAQLKYKNVDWAGKTGTSNFVHDVLFFASNPNITFGTWMGYEHNDSLQSIEQSKRNLQLWAQLINVASDINPELVAPTHRYQQPEGVVSRSYCAISGLLPSDLCQQVGLVKTDLFNVKYVPTKVDDSLVNDNGIRFKPEFLKANGYDKLSNLNVLIPTIGGDRSKWQQLIQPTTNQEKEEEVEVGNENNIKSPYSLAVANNQLTWKIASDADAVKYQIYKATEPSASYTKVGETTSTSFQLGENTGVYYVTAVSKAGEESAPSAKITVKVRTPEVEEPVENEPPENVVEPAEPTSPAPKPKPVDDEDTNEPNDQPQETPNS